MEYFVKCLINNLNNNNKKKKYLVLKVFFLFSLNYSYLCFILCFIRYSFFLNFLRSLVLVFCIY